MFTAVSSSSAARSSSVSGSSSSNNKRRDESRREKDKHNQDIVVPAERTNGSVLDWVEKGGIVFLVGGVIFLAIGVLCYNSFFQCDYVQLPDHADWSTSAGYTLPQFLALVLGTYALPMGLISMLIYAMQSYKSTYWANYWAKAFVYAVLAGVFLYTTRLAYFMSKEVLDCLVFCVGNDATTNEKNDAAIIATGLVYFLVSGALTLLFASLSILSIFANFDAALHEASEGILDGGKTSKSSSSSSSSSRSESKPLLSDSKSSPSERIATYARRSRARSTQMMLAMALTFGALYPLLFIACMALPTWWAYFSKHGIQAYEASRPPKTYGYYTEFNVGSNLVLKLYPDILIYYGAIYIVSAVALLSNYYSPLLNRLASRPRVLLGFTLGEFVLFNVLVALLCGQFAYWYLDHGWENEDRSIRTKAELAARSVGQVANMVVGLLVLPVTRNSVWTAFFGLSFESLIAYHQILGYLFLALIVVHALLWWVVYAQQGTFPHDIFAVPMKYHKDNFTVPLAVLSAVLALVIMGVLSLPSFRRKHYDIFYWAHHFSLVIFLVMLWHSTMSWYYITAGLTLWAADHAIRLFRAIGIAVRMDSATIEGDGNVVHLTYSVARPTSVFFRSAYGALPCEMGQYCFINIPAVSQLSWHPFTISSSPLDMYTHHHIKSQGEDEWTERLLMVVRASQASQGKRGPKPKPLAINIDGPYGVPLDVNRYRSILLIAGGIGVTPMHASYKHLYQTSQGDERWTLAHIKSIRLIWVVSTYQDASIFHETLYSMQSEGNKRSTGPAPTFTYSLYVTNSRQPADLEAIGVSSSDKKSPPKSDRDRRERDRKSGLVNEKGQQSGRPDLQAEILSMAPWSSEAVVFACGPKGLIDACDGYAQKAKVHFRREEFEF